MSKPHAYAVWICDPCGVQAAGDESVVACEVCGREYVICNGDRAEHIEGTGPE